MKVNTTVDGRNDENVLVFPSWSTNVASGTTQTISELVAACCRVSGLRPEIAYSGHVRPGDAEKWVVDISRLKELGFAPRTHLERGLAAVYEWYSELPK